MPKEQTYSIVRTDDGRHLAYTEYGDPGGKPVIYCHGLPSSRLEAGLADRVAGELAIRLIAIDRPGVGGSSFQHNRRLLDWPNDVTALADMLGIQQFDMLGVSGGAPYAVACAWKFPDRLKAVGIVAGLGPPDMSESWIGMPAFARFILAAAQHVPRVLHVSLYGMIPGIKLSLYVMYRYFAWTLSTADQQTLGQKDVENTLRHTFDMATRNGARGVLQELVVAGQSWGFNPAEIDVPVFLWHGEADRMVPSRFGHFLDQTIPGCRSWFMENEGHYSLPVNHMEEILTTLVAQTESGHAVNTSL